MEQLRRAIPLVICYEGPQVDPVCQEMLAPTSKIVGRGSGKDAALITDGRFSGATCGNIADWSRFSKQQSR